MPWIGWVLVGAASLRAGIWLLVLWDRRAAARRSSTVAG
jgi:hypothetical protein